MKEKMKKFFTLSKSKNAGFTLVELIVVIAILAILAGVGVPAYSAYVTKANKQADMTLVSEVKNAVELARYANFQYEITDTVTIKLTNSGIAVEGSSVDDVAFVEDALAATFGESAWQNLSLKYSGWTANASDAIAIYTQSSFNGKTEQLVNKMGSLTGALGEFFADGHSVPSAITSVLQENGADPSATSFANGAVSVLASQLSGLDSTTRDKVVAALGDPNTGASEKSDKLKEIYVEVYANIADPIEKGNMVMMAAAATLYAYSEAFSQYAQIGGYNQPADSLNNIQFTETGANGEEKYLSAEKILTNIENAYQDIQDNIIASYGTDYFNFVRNYDGTNDAKAIFAVMDALADSSDVLNANLENGSFYTDGTAANLITAYISVGDLNLQNGEGAVVVLPDYTVVVYLGGMLQ